MLKLLTLLCVVAVVYAEKVRYDGYQVLRINSVTKDQARLLRTFLESPEIDVWSTQPSIDFMIRPDRVKSTMAFLSLIGLHPQVWIKDVQQRIDAENPLYDPKAPMDWTNYHDFRQIHLWLSDLPLEYPDILTLKNIGTSYEGRNLDVLIINKDPSVDKPIVWIDANIHAREWITSATVTWMINEMLTSTDPEVMQLLDDWEFHIMPVMNPDGFEFSHTNNRLWRKTRTKGIICYGADPNRNWGYHWNEGGSSGSGCSDTYHGPDPFSEPCVKHSEEYMISIKEKTKLYLSYHSYSQLFLLPWGYTYTHPADYSELYEFGQTTADAIYSSHSTRFTVGTIPDLLYIASGGSSDWAKGHNGVKYSFTLELRDQGQYGFTLPANQIIPSGEENLVGLIALLNAIKAAP